jgi:hypothetical protein
MYFTSCIYALNVDGVNIVDKDIYSASRQPTSRNKRGREESTKTLNTLTSTTKLMNGRTRAEIMQQFASAVERGHSKIVKRLQDEFSNDKNPSKNRDNRKTEVRTARIRSSLFMALHWMTTIYKEVLKKPELLEHDERAHAQVLAQYAEIGRSRVSDCLQITQELENVFRRHHNLKVGMTLLTMYLGVDPRMVFVKEMQGDSLIGDMIGKKRKHVSCVQDFTWEKLVHFWTQNAYKRTVRNEQTEQTGVWKTKRVRVAWQPSYASSIPLTFQNTLFGQTITALCDINV